MRQPSPTMVGRQRESERAHDALTAAREGLGSVIFIEGEPGIGKSRFVREVGATAASAGYVVIDAACDVMQRSIPFAPLLRALGRLGLSKASELGADGALTPVRQYQVVTEISDLVERLAAHDPVLMVVDDLQWADDSTLLALRMLGTHASSQAFLSIAAMRSGHGRADLDHVVDVLVRDGASHIELGPLDDGDVTGLAADLLGHEPDADLLNRLRGASGNPLFVIEYLHALSDAPAGDERAGASSGTPPAFRKSVLRRLHQLPAPVQEVVRFGAILGRSFDPRDLARATEQTGLDLAPALERAVQAGVLEGRGVRLAFRHDLVRDAVYEHVPAGVRRQLHREVGLRLAAADADAVVVAHHLELGSGPTDAEAAGWLLRAARDAAPRAPGVAADLFERARAMFPAGAPELAGLQVDLVLAYAWSAQFAKAEALGAEVLARRLDASTDAQLRSGLLRALTWQGRPMEALRLAGWQPSEALEGADGALLAAETALAALFCFDFPRSIPAAVRGVELGRATGNDLALCLALSVQVWLTNFRGMPHDAVALAEEAIAVADASEGELAHGAHPQFFIGMPLVLLDRLDEAVHHLQAGRRRAEARGHVWSLPLFHAHLGVARFVAGEWDAAIAEIEAGIAIADELGLSTAVVNAASGWLTVMHLHRDDLAEAERTVAAALARVAEAGPRAGPVLDWGRARLSEARSDVGEALRLLQGACDTLLSGAGTTDPWSAMTLVRLCVATGDLDRAAALLSVVDGQAESTGTPYMRAQALRCRGLVEGNVDVLLAAVAEYRQCPRPLEHAAGCEDAARALARAGRGDEAATLFEEALDLYAGLGAEFDHTRVRAELRELGVRRGSRRPRVRAQRGWESLTETESKVAELVAQRLSNPEVAARLFISRYTVESHLKQIYRKLEVGSRSQLAALAASRVPTSG